MIAQIAIDLPNFEALDYLYVPKNSLKKPKESIVGHWVIVEVRNKKKIGLVVGLKSDTSARQVKQIEVVIDNLPPVDESFIKFLTFIANYYHRALGKVVFNSFPTSLKSIKNLEADYINKKKNYFFGPNEINKKKNQHMVSWELNQEQKKCYESICLARKPILLHGTTGSGKTRVYFSVIKKLLQDQKSAQVLYLVPEIGLTPRLHELLQSYFSSSEIEVYNSTQTPLARAKTWLKMSTGKANIVLGTRMAIFLPLPNLKLIIVDEEHDTSFKQSEGFRYSARDLAVYRASILGIKLILGSATPSLESWMQSKRTKYKYLAIKNRASNQPLPKLTIFKKNYYSHEHGISEKSLKLLKTHISSGNQALLYLNKKGWAPVFSCTECNWSAKCINCSVNLVLHKEKKEFLLCHFCGHEELPTRICRNCGSNRLKLSGMGTEQLTHKISELLPNARIMRIDKQLIKRKKEFDDCLNKIENGDVDIIIGTQILTKGHDFTKVSLVIAMEIESNLKHPDFRASERLFQSLIQVSGRAGRHPQEPTTYQEPVFITEVIDTQNDFLTFLSNASYVDFAENLIKERKNWSLPPFTNLATINLTHPNRDILENETDKILVALDEIVTNFQKSKVKYSGPLKVFPEKLSKKYRSRILLEANKRADLHKVLYAIKPKIINIVAKAIIDVDPIDF